MQLQEYEMLIDIPKDSSEAIYTTDGMGSETKMLLPSQAQTLKPELTEHGTVMYESAKSDVAFNVEPLQIVGDNEQTIEGLRTSVIIDKENNIKNIIEPAWAKDANGNSINSYYKLNGNSLVQVVAFKCFRKLMRSIIRNRYNYSKLSGNKINL